MNSAASSPAVQRGSLIVVGFGMRFSGQCTPEVRGAIEASDVVYSVTGDVVAQAWLERLHPHVMSLQHHYQEGRPRFESYEAMTQTIVEAVQSGQKVCAVFYGHPGVFVAPSHEAINRLRLRGYEAQMLPGISAEDCLYADLGVDPGRLGCQSYEATDFLINARRIDPTAALVLWQVGVIGEWSVAGAETGGRYLDVLADVLGETYPSSHRVTVYEAATLPVTRPRIETLALEDLPRARLFQQSTLFVPPLAPPTPDRARLARLGMAL